MINSREQGAGLEASQETNIGQGSRIENSVDSEYENSLVTSKPDLKELQRAKTAQVSSVVRSDSLELKNELSQVDELSRDLSVDAPESSLVDAVLEQRFDDCKETFNMQNETYSSVEADLHSQFAHTVDNGIRKKPKEIDQFTNDAELVSQRQLENITNDSQESKQEVQSDLWLSQSVEIQTEQEVFQSPIAR